MQYTPQLAAQDARRIAESMTLKAAPLDVEGLAASIGLRVQKHPLLDSISGFLKKMDDEWIIGVNALHHPRRQRFTIAHELGHYFLHRHIGEFTDQALFRAGGRSTPEEWEANRFAATLLMPADLFGPMIAKKIPLSDIAKSFGVSELAAEFRKKSLNEERIAV